MTDPKPLTEWTPASLRGLLDKLHTDRHRYGFANRIVEIRSCDLEIAEATRALTIINRRATEAEDQRAAEERTLAATVRGLRNALLGWRDDVKAATLDHGWQIIERINEILELAPSDERTLTEERVREVVAGVSFEEIDHATTWMTARVKPISDAIATRAAKELSGAVVGTEQRDRIVTIADEAFGLGPVEPLDATLTRIERGISEQHKRLVNLEAQREADLREAFSAGIGHGEGWLTDEAREAACGPDEEAAAEYARSKAGG